MLPYNLNAEPYSRLDALRLWLDDRHPTFWPTMVSFLMYTEALNARFAVLDDITLNDEMRRAWGIIRRRHRDDALDATEVHPEIRSGGAANRPGFGIVRMRS